MASPLRSTTATNDNNIDRVSSDINCCYKRQRNNITTGRLSTNSTVLPRWDHERTKSWRHLRQGFTCTHKEQWDSFDATASIVTGPALTGLGWIRQVYTTWSPVNADYQLWIWKSSVFITLCTRRALADHDEDTWRRRRQLWQLLSLPPNGNTLLLFLRSLTTIEILNEVKNA